MNLKTQYKPDFPPKEPHAYISFQCYIIAFSRRGLVLRVRRELNGMGRTETESINEKKAVQNCEIPTVGKIATTKLIWLSGKAILGKNKRVEQILSCTNNALQLSVE